MTLKARKISNSHKIISGCDICIVASTEQILIQYRGNFYIKTFILMI